MARWIDDIVQAMKNLGGQAKYAELYEEVRRVRNGPLSKEWKATVRRTVENHSSDSKNYRDHRTDYFYSVHGKGQGVWALRQEHRNESSTGSKAKDPKEAYQVKSSEVTLTRYERDAGARKECLDHYGYGCSRYAALTLRVSTDRLERASFTFTTSFLSQSSTRTMR